MVPVRTVPRIKIGSGRLVDESQGGPDRLDYRRSPSWASRGHENSGVHVSVPRLDASSSSNIQYGGFGVASYPTNKLYMYGYGDIRQSTSTNENGSFGNMPHRTALTIFLAVSGHRRTLVVEISVRLIQGPYIVETSGIGEESIMFTTPHV